LKATAASLGSFNDEWLVSKITAKKMVGSVNVDVSAGAEFCECDDEYGGEGENGDENNTAIIRSQPVAELPDGDGENGDEDQEVVKPASKQPTAKQPTAKPAVPKAQPKSEAKTPVPKTPVSKKTVASAGKTNSTNDKLN
jgi:hypothetical protein